MSEETALTATRHSALETYGHGDDIKKMAERIRMCLPGGNRLTVPEALAVSQLAIAYSLNPFNGEVWGIKAKDGTFHGTMVGIKGLRKAARKQANYWIEHALLTNEERTALAIPDNAIAYKCLVYRTDLIRQSAEAISLMYQAGMKDAAERYAYRPTVGIGQWRPGEQTKMKGDQAARKRAEAEALKQAFDLPFASEAGNGDRIGYADSEWESTIEGEATPVDDPGHLLYPDADFEGYEDQPEPPPSGPPWTPETVQAGEDAPEPANGRPLDAEKVRDIIRRKAGWQGGQRLEEGEPITEKQIPYVATLMGDLYANLDTELRKKARYDALNYLLGVTSTKDLYKREASAIIDWITKDEDSARIEAARILETLAVEAGQQALPM